MIYPDVPLDKWLKKTGIEVGNFDCPKCKKTFVHSVPCVSKDYYGVETPIHECGAGFKSVIFTPRSAEKMTLWRKILGGL